MMETARTLRRLPNPPGSWPKGYGSVPAGVCAGRQARQSHPRDASACDPEPGEIPGMEGCADWLSFVAPEDAGMSGCLRALRWLPRRPLAANPPPSWLSSALSLGASCGGSAKHSQPTEHKREIVIRFLAGQKATDEAVAKPRESDVNTVL